MDDFTCGYVEAALWTMSDDVGEPLDHLSVDDISPGTLAEIVEDCRQFQADNTEDLKATGASDEQNGHDFWLTRCGHGVGFWDRGYGAVGASLSDAAHVWGNVDLYLGDDGLVYA